MCPRRNLNGKNSATLITAKQSCFPGFKARHKKLQRSPSESFSSVGYRDPSWPRSPGPTRSCAQCRAQFSMQTTIPDKLWQWLCTLPCTMYIVFASCLFTFDFQSDFFPRKFENWNAELEMSGPLCLWLEIAWTLYISKRQSCSYIISKLQVRNLCIFWRCKEFFLTKCITSQKWIMHQREERRREHGMNFTMQFAKPS